MTAPIENVSVNYSIANVVFNIGIKQANPLFHLDKSIEMRKNNGTKRNQGTF